MFFNKSKGDASALAAAGAANAVDVVFVGGGLVEVDDVADVWDVEAAGSDIGGDEDAGLVVFECFEGFLALGLGFVAVDSDGRDVLFFEVVGKALDAVFGFAKEEDFFKFLV